MLAQHLITKPVFDALFAGLRLRRPQPGLAGHGDDARPPRRRTAWRRRPQHLEGFYDSVRVRAERSTTPRASSSHRRALREVLQDRASEDSPTRSASSTPRSRSSTSSSAPPTRPPASAFGRGLTDEGVHILDPFTGTGTFIVRLLQSGLIKPRDLARKYADELHANEIMLLAYYIAAVNIETTYHALAPTTATYTSRSRASCSPTPSRSPRTATRWTLDMFPAEQRTHPARSWPPRSTSSSATRPTPSARTSANDDNANLAYPTLDGRIARHLRGAVHGDEQEQPLRLLHSRDSWATDRIGDQGVVAFVSNGGWIDGNTADGIRMSLAEEYSPIYVYNLRGNQRTAGELSRKEGGKVFGAGSRNTVAIFIGVKDPNHSGPCEVHYRDIGDYLTREEKLRIVADGTLATVDWQTITPNSHGDWISQRNDEFADLARHRRQGRRPSASLSTTHADCRPAATPGSTTSREQQLGANVRADDHTSTTQLERSSALRATRGSRRRNAGRPSRAHRSATRRRSAGHRSLITKLAAGGDVTYDRRRRSSSAPIAPSSGSTFTSTRDLNHRRWTTAVDFPDAARMRTSASTWSAPGPTSRSLPHDGHDSRPACPGARAAGPVLPPLDLREGRPRRRRVRLRLGDGDVDEHGYRRVDNITDDIVELYEQAIGDPVAKDDVFHYVYGLLHDPAYRKTYAADLRKMLPRIPTPSTESGSRSSSRRAARWPTCTWATSRSSPTRWTCSSGPAPTRHDRETWRVAKMKWKTKGDHTAIVYNPKVTIAGIPEEAERYQLGSRSALGWIIDRYQRKVDKASGIVNDPNDWCDEHDDPTYIVDLIKRVDDRRRGDDEDRRPAGRSRLRACSAVPKRPSPIRLCGPILASWPALGGAGRCQPGTPDPATRPARTVLVLVDLTIGGIGARSGVDAVRAR